MSETQANYRLGVLYGLATALLYSIQQPFLSEAARQLGSAAFIGVSQLALLLAVPFMLVRRKSRADFIAIFRNAGLYGKLLALLALGVAAIVCIQFGLKGANPIVVAAILNLSPFWAALVAKLISRKPIPVSPLVFFACFLVAFVGAMLIAFSQKGTAWGDIFRDFRHATWLFALPLPLLSALNGTLIGEWFRDYDDSAALAANFLLAVCVVVPIAGIVAIGSGDAGFGHATLIAIGLLIVGTVASSAIGRVTYQIALTATGNDNGFVSMFLLLVPALAVLFTLPLSWLLPDLSFSANIGFFIGLGLVSVSLLFFSTKVWREGTA